MQCLVGMPQLVHSSAGELTCVCLLAVQTELLDGVIEARLAELLPDASLPAFLDQLR